MIRRTPIRRKPKQAKESAPWRTPRIQLGAIEYGRLKSKVFERAHQRCENGSTGARCKNFIHWWNFEPHHTVRRSHGGSDTAENILAVCHECHRQHHDGKIKIVPHRDWIPV